MYLCHEELEFTILINKRQLNELAGHLEQTGFMTADRWNLFNAILLELSKAYNEVYEDRKRYRESHSE